jgi:hypothetical protein
MIGVIMKVINLHQILAVSGGTYQEVRKYEDFTSVGTWMGAAAGILGGIVYAISFKSIVSLPVAVVASGTGLMAGPVIGYTAGAIGYHANNLTANVMDYFFKPAD